jgi:hypothetical protein
LKETRIIMHNRIGRWLLVLFAISVLLSACSDEPTEQNALLTPHLPYVEMAVRESTIVADSGTTFREYAAMNSTASLVGRTGNYSASMILAFYSSYFQDRDTVRVLSAKLHLHGASFYGDSTGQVGFTVHRLNRSWSQTTFTWDSLGTDFYDASDVRGTYAGRIGKDTEEVVIDLDTVMARQWLITPTTTEASYRYGMIFVPTSSATTVRGFQSFENDSSNWVPTLVLICQNAAGTVTDTSTFTNGIDTFVGNIDDLNSDPKLFYLQAGVNYRSIVKFDVSWIPKGAIVNSADLTLQRDPSTSFINRFAGDTSIAVHPMEGSLTTSSFGSGSTAKLIPGSLTTYSADVAGEVQAWVRGANYGALLRIYGVREFESFTLVTLYGNTADNAHKPRLKIIYSVPKN